MSLARNTAIISGLTLVSRVLGFARDLVLAAALGAGPVADAFFAALRFPNLFRRLFAEGAFSQAFVPTYSKTLAGEGPARADGIAGEALAVLTFATTALTVLAQLAMPWLNLVLFAGYRDDPAAFDLATRLTQITMPYLIAMTMATLFSGVLNARGRFVLAAGAPTLLNLCILLAVLPFRDDATAAAYAAAAGVSVAGLAQALVLYLGLRRQGVRLKRAWPVLTPDVKRLIGLAVPGAIAGGALQINVLISQILASFEQGAITYLNVADRLYQLPLGLIGIAVGVAMLPRLSRLVQQGDGAGARGALDEAVALSMAFTLPAAAAFLTAPFFIIDATFTRGAFTPSDARACADALFHYAWGLPAFVLAKIYAPAFFARDDTRAPMRYALISMGLNVVLGAGLFFALRALGAPGFTGLAAATSLAAWANVALMVRTLVRRGSYGPDRKAAARFARLFLAAAALAMYVGWAALNREALEDWFGAKEGAIAFAVLAGGVLYFACLFLFRAVTVREVRAAFRREKGAPPVLDS